MTLSTLKNIFQETGLVEVFEPDKRLDAGDLSHKAYVGLMQAKGKYGWSKIVMSGFLYIFHRDELWKGQAQSWPEFLAQEKIPYASAMLWIRIFEFYVLKLALPKEVLERLIMVDSTGLDRARKTITPENVDEWVEKLTTLSRSDVLLELKEANGESAEEEVDEEKVTDLIGDYNKLPPEGKRLFTSITNTPELKGMIRKYDKLNEGEWREFMGRIH